MGTCGRVNLGRLERLETYRVTLPRAVERKKERKTSAGAKLL